MIGLRPRLGFCWGERVEGISKGADNFGMGSLADIHRKPGNLPLAYFLTVRTYGTWLHGDVRGSVDRLHNVRGTPRVAANAWLERSAAGRMKHGAVVFGAAAAALVEEAVRGLCTHRGWHLFAVNMRSNHLHVVVEAKVSAERALADMKARTTRRLREEGYIKAMERPWAVHGSTPYLWTTEQLLGAIEYVEHGQGGELRGG